MPLKKYTKTEPIVCCLSIVWDNFYTESKLAEVVINLF